MLLNIWAPDNFNSEFLPLRQNVEHKLVGKLSKLLHPNKQFGDLCHVPIFLPSVNFNFLLLDQLLQILKCHIEVLLTSPQYSPLMRVFIISLPTAYLALPAHASWLCISQACVKWKAVFFPKFSPTQKTKSHQEFIFSIWVSLFLYISIWVFLHFVILYLGIFKFGVSWYSVFVLWLWGLLVNQDCDFLRRLIKNVDVCWCMIINQFWLDDCGRFEI